MNSRGRVQQMMILLGYMYRFTPVISLYIQPYIILSMDVSLINQAKYMPILSLFLYSNQLSIKDIQSQLHLSYVTVHTAIKFWIGEGIINRIDYTNKYEINTTHPDIQHFIAIHQAPQYRRAEMDIVESTGIYIPNRDKKTDKFIDKSYGADYRY